MANESPVPLIAAQMDAALVQVPPLVGQLIVGVLRVPILAAQLAMSLVTLSVMVPLLATSFLVQMTQWLNDLVGAGPASQPASSEYAEGAPAEQPYRRDVPVRPMRASV